VAAALATLVAGKGAHRIGMASISCSPLPRRDSGGTALRTNGIRDKKAAAPDPIQEEVIPWLDREIKTRLNSLARQMDRMEVRIENCIGSMRDVKRQLDYTGPFGDPLFSPSAPRTPHRNTSVPPVPSEAPPLPLGVGPLGSLAHSNDGRVTESAETAPHSRHRDSVDASHEPVSHYYSHWSRRQSRKGTSQSGQAAPRRFPLAYMKTRTFGHESSSRKSSNGPSLLRSGTKRTSAWSEASKGSVRSLALYIRRIRRHGVVQAHVWNFLEDPDSSSFAWWYANLMCYLLVVTVIVPLIQTIEGSPLQGVLANVIETCIEGLFFIEVSIRYCVYPNRRSFLFGVYNIVDILCVVPLIVRLVAGCVLSGDSTVCRALPNIVPAIRLLKVLRYFQTFQLLLSAFRRACDAVPVLLFTYSFITLTFSSFIYFAEPRENIGSLPTAMWLTIVTMTTVGYGDITPTSPAGSAIVACLVISSVVLTAFPLGIIGSTFTSVWRDRDRILLMQRTRDCLDHWGFGADEMWRLFESVDRDGDGELILDEFRGLVKHMGIGMREDRIMRLFRTFDFDMTGTINYRKFVNVLFPGALAYHGDHQMDELSDDSEPWRPPPPPPPPEPEPVSSQPSQPMSLRLSQAT